MLATSQPILRRFWYPLMPLVELEQGPQAFTLLGEPLVLWLDAQGNPAATLDRCCHRQAKLSTGKVIEGCIRCPYHGWEFDPQGACVRVPQHPDRPIPSSYRITAFACRAHYGYAWVCLEEPLDTIPEFPEANDPHFRLIPAFYETWNCSGLRLMENAFDHGHHHFVHNQNLGDKHNPIPIPYNQLRETERGIYFQSILYTYNNPRLQKSVHLEQETLEVQREVEWYLPFGMRSRMEFPNGLVHTVVMYATPISDSSSQIVRFYFRNDAEADTPATDAIAFERPVLNEDKAILEATDYDAPLDLSKEQHMDTDKPGIMMRHKLSALLKSHGEVESCRA